MTLGRVKLIFSDEKPLFITKISVRINDINYGGHLGNDSLLSLLHEARLQMLTSKGYSELNAFGNSLIMADVMIAYKAEAFYGDVLTVKIFAESLTARSFDLMYHVSTTRDGKTIDIAHAKTGMVCFDYKERKIANMTDEFKLFLEGK